IPNSLPYVPHLTAFNCVQLRSMLLNTTITTDVNNIEHNNFNYSSPRTVGRKALNRLAFII
ncbi:MAG: hypothetical protein ACRD8W_13970, partial [Nitrososphaeraceae archaeon]